MSPLEELAPGLTASLSALPPGEPWRICHSENHNPSEVLYLESPSTRLLLGLSRYGSGRLEVSWAPPGSMRGMDCSRYGHKRPSATFDPARPVEKLAAEINRRMIAACREWTADIRARVQAGEGRMRGADALATHLERVAGSADGILLFNPRRENDREERRIGWFRAGVSGSVEVWGDDDGTPRRVDMKLSDLTAEQAEKIVAVLRLAMVPVVDLDADPEWVPDAR